MSAPKTRSRLVGAMLVGAMVLIATALLAQAAQAAIAPSISLDQSAGTQAGASQNLGMDLQFAAPGSLTVSDTPEDLTIDLPPGLLANAAVDGGACLTTVDLGDANCQVGTGSVTAYAAGLVPLTIDVSFDLVKPPVSGDLAGLAVNYGGTQIGSTADIRVRPSGDPDGVGITIDFVLPDSLDGAPIDISEIDSTFDGLRYPATCPATPANVGIAVNSYGDSTMHSLTAPLQVTGCASLPYAPKLAVSATKDGSDRQVAVTSAVTQAAGESPTRSLSLAFPDATLGVNLAAVRLLCLDVAKGNCTPVGTAVADSPLYPEPLTANAYLTGTALGPTLTLVFPPPFPLTLVGSVTLTTKTASFTGLPDIPLTSLELKLNGGASGMFLTNCNPGAGVADGTSTDQNGDRTVSASVKYEIAGCPASSHSASNGASTNKPPSITMPVLGGVRTGRPSLRFRVSVPRHAARLTQISLRLSHGISFVRHRVGGRLRITGVKIHRARVKSLALEHGRLVISLRRPAAAFRVRLTSVLHESRAVIAAAATHRSLHLRMQLTALNTHHRRHTISRRVRLVNG